MRYFDHSKNDKKISTLWKGGNPIKEANFVWVNLGFAVLQGICFFEVIAPKHGLFFLAKKEREDLNTRRASVLSRISGISVTRLPAEMLDENAPRRHSMIG